MVQDSAQELTRKGTVPFTRTDLIESIHQNSPNCDPNSINPIIQGITDNLKGGAPGAVGKNILHSVGRGLFVLYRQEEGSVTSSPTTRTAPIKSDSTWYYTENRQKVGPVPLDELKDKCRLGELGDEDLVWAEGWESWKKVCDVAELASLEPPPLPPEEPPPLPAELTQSEITDPPLPFAVALDGKPPKTPLFLKNDKEWEQLLKKMWCFACLHSGG